MCRLSYILRYGDIDCSSLARAHIILSGVRKRAVQCFAALSRCVTTMPDVFVVTDNVAACDTTLTEPYVTRILSVGWVLMTYSDDVVVGVEYASAVFIDQFAAGMLVEPIERL